MSPNHLKSLVAPFAGAWIEINGDLYMMAAKMSLRSPERGLKFYRIPGRKEIKMSLRSPERGLK